MMYPTKVDINGKIYPINTDYRVALKCLEIADDEEISDEERILAILYLLFGFIPEDNQELFIEKAKNFLQCNEPTKKHQDRGKDMDFQQDMKYIIPSFISDYNIDLTKDESLHFWLFIDLISGLTEECVLNRIRNIRNTNISDISDDKTRQKLIKAKEDFALKTKHLKLTEKELESSNTFFKSMGIERK